VSAIVPTAEPAVLDRAAAAVQRELESSLAGFAVFVALSRFAPDPVDLYRAGARQPWPRTSVRPRVARR